MKLEVPMSKNSLLALAFVTALPAFGAVNCKPQSLAESYHPGKSVQGQVCSITHVTRGVYGLDPLRSLQTATSVTQQEATATCKNLKLEQAAFITDFGSNSFQVESIGVVNTRFGSTATVNGRFVCVPSGHESVYSILF
jgi:hypothetical protein